jgi:hypothetical protein
LVRMWCEKQPVDRDNKLANNQEACFAACLRPKKSRERMDAAVRTLAGPP